MPTFDWQLSEVDNNGDVWSPAQWQALALRYDTAAGAAGVVEWRAFVARARELTRQPETLEWYVQIREHLATFVQQLRAKPAPRQPTVFVSHQRNDARWAEWAAWAATEAHFDYWLDVHDPVLTKANANGRTPPPRPNLRWRKTLPGPLPN